jgi:hypothetical protein
MTQRVVVFGATVVYFFREQGKEDSMSKDAEIGPAGSGQDMPTGSFTGSKAIEKIQRKKAEEAVERGMAKEKEGGEEDKKQSENDRKIDELLPKEVNSALGMVSFAQFKDMYKEIWEQVESKEHLSKGFCTHTRDIAKNLPVTFRTLRTNETEIVNQFAPDPNDQNFSHYMSTDSMYRKIQLAIGIKEFDGRESRTLELPDDDFDKWKKSTVVVERFNWVDGLPEELTAIMSAILADVTIAYRLALRENLKNQLAPL